MKNENSITIKEISLLPLGICKELAGQELQQKMPLERKRGTIIKLWFSREFSSEKKK